MPQGTLDAAVSITRVCNPFEVAMATNGGLQNGNQVSFRAKR